MGGGWPHSVACRILIPGAHGRVGFPVSCRGQAAGLIGRREARSVDAEGACASDDNDPRLAEFIRLDGGWLAGKPFPTAKGACHAVPLGVATDAVAGTGRGACTDGSAGVGQRARH